MSKTFRWAAVAMGMAMATSAAVADMNPATGMPYNTGDLFAPADAPDVGNAPDGRMPPNNCLAKGNYNSCMACAGRLYESGYLDKEQAWELAARCYAQLLSILECELDYTPAEPWA